jgi:hypothetical protein
MIEGATGKFLLQQMAAVAELEAGMISARTKAAQVSRLLEAASVPFEASAVAV